MMNPLKLSPRTFASVLSTLILGISMSACSMDNKTSWKEEVLLHDGKKIIVERSTTSDPAGRRELGQPAPISEQTLSFTVPGTSQQVTWKSNFGRTTQDNLELLALDVVNGKVYIVTKPTRCHAFDKWGRPNPPYVSFLLHEARWERVAISELPPEIKKANVLVGGYGGKEGRLVGMGIDEKKTKPYLLAEVVDQFNREGIDSSLLVFPREPLKGGGMDCMDPTHNSPKAPDPTSPASQVEGPK